jgi:hypothetical protein
MSKRKIRLATALFLIASVLVFSSCSLLGGYIEFDYETFLSNMQLWQSLNINDYAYRYYGTGFGKEDVEVYVVNGIYDHSEQLEKSISDIYSVIESDYSAYLISWNKF